MAWKPETRAEAVQQDCPRCGLPVLHQRHGLPWVVTADAQRLAPDAADKLVEPNRRAWCIRESTWTGTRLVMVLACARHEGCEHVIEHQCPAEARQYGRRPEGGLW